MLSPEISWLGKLKVTNYATFSHWNNATLHDKWRESSTELEFYYSNFT